MAFHNVRISVDVERGASGGPRFNTTVQTSALSPAETRVQNWAYERGQWDIGYGVRRREDAQEIISFFRSRRGRLHSFRFRDWSDYQANQETFAIMGQGGNTFQLTKTYGRSDPDPYIRKITKPVVSTVEIFQISDHGIYVPVSNVNISSLTGIVTVSAAEVIAGVTLAWSGDFDIPVRFASDELDSNVINFDAIQHPSVQIIEVDE